jgi:hypothetical protein
LRRLIRFAAKTSSSSTCVRLSDDRQRDHRQTETFQLPCFYENRLPVTGATKPPVEPCLACGNTVSVKAYKCPHCGHPRPTAGYIAAQAQLGRDLRKGCLWLVAIAVVGYVLLLVIALSASSN